MMESLTGQRVCASVVSVVNKVLDQEVAAMHKRVLADNYVYLFLDGVQQWVISCSKVVTKLVLVVYGIRCDGQRGVIDFRVVEGIYRAAVTCYKSWRRRWRNVVPRAVICLQCDIEDLLVFYYKTLSYGLN
ncbi:MAG: transposase [bacterium]